MAGRRGVHHDEFLARLADDAREGLKDGDFLGAGRAQILFEQGAPLGVELRAFRPQHFLPVALGFGVGVDAADRQMLHGAMQRLGEMRGRVGGGEMNRQPAPRQFDGDRRRQRRLADAALAHQHDKPMAVGGDVIHEIGEAWRVAARPAPRRARPVEAPFQQGAGAGRRDRPG